MGKVFAVLALLVVVGCADVGEDEASADDSALKLRDQVADAGPAPVALPALPAVETPVELPVVDAGAPLISPPKTGSDAAVAPVAPVPVVAPVAPVAAVPVVEEHVQLTFFDAPARVRFAYNDIGYNEILEFRVDENLKDAVLVRYDEAGKQLGVGRAWDAGGYWTFSFGLYECDVTINEKTERFTINHCYSGEPRNVSSSARFWLIPAK